MADHSTDTASDTPVEIGLISDTHGMVRPEVFTALAGVSRILHAGDVGPHSVLVELGAIAPVQAVRGNTDAPGRSDLVAQIDITVRGVRIVVTHGHELGSPTPEKLMQAYEGADVIVYGHTHKQLITSVGEVTVINPGAAGARRFDLLPSVARLEVYERKRVEVVIVPLLQV